MTQPCMAIREFIDDPTEFPAVFGDGRCESCIFDDACIVCCLSGGRHADGCHTQRTPMNKDQRLAAQVFILKGYYEIPGDPASDIDWDSMGVRETNLIELAVYEQLLCAWWAEEDEWQRRWEDVMAMGPPPVAAMLGETFYFTPEDTCTCIREQLLGDADG